jgi:hypothetical protein
MFLNPGSRDFAKLGRIAGIVLFVVAFLLPAVREGANDYPGWFCAVETLYWNATFFAMLLHHERSVGWFFFMMVSGWIAPLVLFGLIAWSSRIKLGVAIIVPFLLLAPWIVFVLPNGSGPIRPSIGHYIWTTGCLLAFTPEYVKILAPVWNAVTERN